MKFALVNKERQEPQKRLRGTCPECEQPVIAKCGEVRAWHWAHKSRAKCNNRWENEGPWHRAWKNRFPRDWQEIVHQAPDGEKHVADVKTEAGCVLEFQHSYIKPDEIRSRETFYPSLEWVVDGGRRSGDDVSLPRGWRSYTAATTDPPVMAVRITGNPLLRDWVGSAAQVYFDFSENKEIADGDDFWWLSRENDYEWAYVAPYPRENFFERHRHATPGSLADHESLTETFAAGIEELRRKILTHSGLPRFRMSRRARRPTLVAAGIRRSKFLQKDIRPSVVEQTAEQVSRRERIYPKTLEDVPSLSREYATDHPYGFSQDRMEDFLAKEKALRLAKEKAEQLDEEDENGL